MADNDPTGVSQALLRDIEHLAVELARLAAAEIQGTLGSILSVQYKHSTTGTESLRDPVSEVDQRVETIIRTRLDERFPEHDIIGEEYDDRPERNHDFVWAIDPIDGTTNFVNGFPMFAAAIGVLFKGAPIVGATWCSTSHALRPGIYHAREGGRLCFEGELLDVAANPAVRRRLIGLPQIPASGGTRDGRKTGSAAIELAFVAGGMLEACRIDTPNLWDVASGVVLVQASGGTVGTYHADQWQTFGKFDVSDAGEASDLRLWKQPIAAGRLDLDDLAIAVQPSSVLNS